MKHGHTMYVRHGCRCAVCKEAKNAASRRYYHRTEEVRVDARPAQRMAACLRKEGASVRALERVTGMSSARVVHFRKKVETRTHHAIERLHWGLWMRSPRMRRECGCEMPEWVRDELEAA